MSRQRDVLMIVVALVAGAIGGAGSSWFLMNRLTVVQGQAPPAGVIRAERFEIVSRDGKIQAMLGEPTAGFLAEHSASPKEQPGFTEEEKKRLEEKSSPGLLLLDGEGKIRVVLSARADGSVVLWLSDTYGYVSTLDANHMYFSGPKGGYVDLFSGGSEYGPSLQLSSGPEGRYVALNATEPFQGGGPALTLLGPAANGGKDKASLSVNQHGPRLDLDGRTGDWALLDADEDGPSLRLDVKKGEDKESDSISLRVPSQKSKDRFKDLVDVNHLGPSLSLSNEKAWASLDVDQRGPRLEFTDRTGSKLRTALGVSQLKDPRTGSVETRPPSSLVLFGENGEVIWQAP